MVTPLRVYRHSAEILQDALYHSYSGSSAADLLYMEDSQPGHMTTLESGFIIRGKLDPGQDNSTFHFETPGGILKTVTLETSSSSGLYENYDGVYLAQELQNKMDAATSPGWFTVAWSTTKNKFTITSTVGNFEINWLLNPSTIALANTMGYTPQLCTGAAEYESDNAVFCSDQHWIVWDMQNALSRLGPDPRPVECFMVYCPTLDSGDTIQLFGINAVDYKGPDRLRYINGGCLYEGEKHTSTANGINEIFVWQPVARDGTPGVLCRFWLLAIERKGAATIASNTRIGCCAAWEAPHYEGDRNYRSPYIVDPVVNDRTSYPEGGGAAYRLQQRAYYEADLDFMRFGAGTYRGVEEMFAKFGKFEGLWLLNPDEHNQDEMLFCHPDLEVTEKDGPGRVVSFRCHLRQIPMHPREG